jgi:Ni,Fe-hydrogenase III small subunit
LKAFPVFTGVLKKKMRTLGEFSLVRVFSQSPQHACVLTRGFCADMGPLIKQYGLAIAT